MTNDSDLEERLRKLGKQASQVSDKTIRDQVLGEIDKLREEKTQKNESQQRNTPKREVIIQGYAPIDLTTNYTYLGIERLTSDVYSTDTKATSTLLRIGHIINMAGYTINPGAYHFHKPDSPICGEELAKWGYRNHRYYKGKAEDYIEASLREKIEKKVREKNADLVIVVFTINSPFKFNIYECSGLGKTNFQGQVNAKFYAKKS